MEEEKEGGERGREGEGGEVRNIISSHAFLMHVGRHFRSRKYLYFL